MDKSASILTRVRVPDFEAWKPMFDRDEPGARAASTGWQVFRAVEDGNEVFIRVDFASLEEATTARDKLIASGVLERFPDHLGPTVVQAAEVIDR